MSQKFEITIAQDTDGFLGYDPEAIAQIDIEASKEAYEKQLTQKINKYYPDLIITIEWDGSRSTYTWPMEDEPETYKDLQDDLEWITEEVYNSQKFWVTK